ncbi:MAG: hypothetical protein HYZ81_11765 [Nitrospinae bacterium]|nr:hypothetical protein [Nitrospinota bacterium]
MSEALDRATQTITEAELPRMVLSQDELPPALREFLPLRAGILDNDTMADQGFPGNTSESFRALGRITGYMREFVAPAPRTGDIPVGYDLAAATVVHLFDDAQGVSRWMQEIFLGQFEANVDQESHPGQHLLMVERLQFRGFSDEVAGLRVLQSGTTGPVSSTVVDFRVGRLLGVAYVATFGNYERRALVERLGLELERRMVRVVLGDL